MTKKSATNEVMPSADRKTQPAPEVYGPPAPDPAAPMARGLLLLPPNLAALEKLTGDERADYALAGVKLTSTQEGYRAEATDGKYTGIVTGPLPVLPLEYPTWPALEQAGGGKASALIPAAPWVEAFKLAPKKSKAFKPALANVAAVLAANEATFGATDLERGRTLTTRQVEGRFPDVKRAIPAGEPAASVAVDVATLIELLQVAKQYAGPDKIKRVVIELRRGENGRDTKIPIVVRAQNEDGQQFTGVLTQLV